MIEYIADCIIGTPLRLDSLIDVMTGIPPSVVAQMQVKGMIKELGVWAPEQVIPPEHFFNELAKREICVQVTTRQELT